MVSWPLQQPIGWFFKLSDIWSMGLGPESRMDGYLWRITKQNLMHIRMKLYSIFSGMECNGFVVFTSDYLSFDEKIIEIYSG